MDASSLPTHLARAVDRMNRTGPAASADSFLLASYVAEAFLKTLAVTLLGVTKRSAPALAYSVAYELVRADGLGAWESAITTLTTSPNANYLSREVSGLLEWVTKKRDSTATDWFGDAARAVKVVLKYLEVPQQDIPDRATTRHILKALVVIRNKTKAHGAVGPNFFAEVNESYALAVAALVAHCPLNDYQWMHLSTRVDRNEVRGVQLRGMAAKYIPSRECQSFSPAAPGVYFCVPPLRHAYSVNDLLRSDLECNEFFLPNGGFRAGGDAEFIDYGAGRTKHLSAAEFGSPPAELPESETAGLSSMDVQGNMFGNLPAKPRGYIHRPALEDELRRRLSDSNHSVITLHGRGGVGKTTLGLFVLHDLAGLEKPTFETVLWFSSRDVDLSPSGPKRVRADVNDVRAIAEMFGTLTGKPGTADELARALSDPKVLSTASILFVFDNFETLEDARLAHQFVDEHVRLPNKALITSRERAFKGDFPIEVRGMDESEAVQLCEFVARDLGVESLVSQDAIRSIWEYTDGHPYVMRLLLGDVAKEGRYVPPTTSLPRRVNILQEVFERSFNKLSRAGRWSFLVVGSWRSTIPLLPLLVVGGRQGVDIEQGLEECVRLSLLVEDQLADGTPCYWAPQLARIFAQKKLDGDPERLAFQVAVESLRRFGALSPARATQRTQEQVVQEYMRWAFTQVTCLDSDELQQLDQSLVRIAEAYPNAWHDVVRFRQARSAPPSDISYAFRRLVEERPFDKVAWIQRAAFAEFSGDSALRVSCLISAVDCDPADAELIRETAYQLCQYLDSKKWDIPRSLRGVYLAGLREHMVRVSDRMDATGLSRLAWLYLLEDNRAEARKWAEKGLEVEPDNRHCQNLVERLRR